MLNRHHKALELDKILDAVSAVGEHSLDGLAHSVDGPVTVDLGDVGDTCDDSLTVPVAQTLLHVVLVVEFGGDHAVGLANLGFFLVVIVMSGHDWSSLRLLMDAYSRAYVILL